jgi:hypothetical protein
MLALKDEPHLTVHKRGTISINRSAFEALDSPEAVELLYDKGRSIIGLRPIEQRAENAYHVRRPSNSPSGPWVISAMAFTKFYDIDTSATVRWVAYVDGEILCTDISAPGRPVGTNRRSR